MKKGQKKIRIPNPHGSGDIYISLVKEIQRQAGICLVMKNGIIPDLFCVKKLSCREKWKRRTFTNPSIISVSFQTNYPCPANYPPY
jgi:hypothetical protein